MKIGEFYESIIQSTTEAILVIDLNSRIILVNNSAIQLWDYSAQEFKENNASILIESDAFQDWLERLTLNTSENEISQLYLKDSEVMIYTKYGYKNPAIIACSPLLDNDKKVKGGVVTITDLTEKKYFEKAFWENEEKLKYVTLFSKDAIIMIDPKGKICFWNSAATKIFGYTDEDVYGVDLHKLLAPVKYHAAYRSGFNEFLKTGKGNAINETLELSALRKSGEEFPIELSLTSMMINKKWNAIGIIRDISERKLAEQKIIDSEAYFRTLLDTSPDAIITTDNEGNITYGSKKAIEMFNISANDKFLGTSILSWVDPEYQNIVLERIAGIFEGINKPQLSQYRLLKADGISFDCESNSAPILNSDQNIAGLLIVVHDITERKRVEKELIAAKEKAEESDRLKAAFIQNLSHEIRTPMNALVGFSELLKDPDQPEDDKKIFIDNIIDGTNQLLTIITDLVEISNIKTGLIKINPIEIDPDEILDEISSSFAGISSGKQLGLTIENSLRDKKNMKVVADKVLLSKVMNQLVRNAIKFTPKGEVTVGCIREKNHIKFFVNDTGIGIPSDLQGRIFESFFQVENSISRRYEGTGLGLAIAKAYVELQGSKIELHSEPGHGSKFSFCLPYICSELIIGDNPDVINASTSYTILVAEDDANNFKLISTYLHEAKFKILHASNGLEAVNICKSDEKIDLILMDMRMPVMDGFEATRQIKKIRPDAIILSQTAYADEMEKILDCGCIGSLSKPFVRKQLLETVSDYLTDIKV